jgi:hypothetical protein
LAYNVLCKTASCALIDLYERKRAGGKAVISDVLFDSIERIDWFLAEYQNVYSGNVRKRIMEVRDAMDALRAELNTIPGT